MNTMTTEPIKYAGADWMLARQNPPAVSVLGIKVMNILGQVYQGIYHIDDHVLSPKVRWDGVFSVAVTVYGCLSTYDFSQLSMLVMCCQKAEVSVGVYGSFKGYTKLIFCPNPGGSEILPMMAIGEDSTIEERLGQCTRIKKKLHDIDNGGIWSTDGLHWHHLLAIFEMSHRLATRVQVQGRSPQSLEVMATQRLREGGISQRHPRCQEHTEMMRPYWDVDYVLP
jgi:hypothetical protein